VKLYLSLLVAIAMLVSIYSCENSDREAGCNVNGVWLGRWQIDGGEGGTFITPVSQNETRFEGNIFIRFDLPSLENHGVDFSGRILDQRVKCMIEISGVRISVTGDIANDSLVSGNFDVSLGFSGNYQGKKIPIQPIDVSEMYHIENTNNWYGTILYVNNTIWLPDNSNNTISVINNDGHIVKTLSGNFITNASAFDGEHIWSYGYDSENGGEKIIEYDTLGNILDYLEVPSYFVDALAFEGSQLYYADNYNRQVYHVDESGSIADSIPALYSSFYSFIFRDHKMLFTPGYTSVIYSMNSMGEIDKACQLPIEHIQTITTDNNGTFWCLAVKYNIVDNGLGSSDYMIYRFSME
jgi:hypothetical protein